LGSKLKWNLVRLTSYIHVDYWVIGVEMRLVLIQYYFRRLASTPFLPATVLVQCLEELLFRFLPTLTNVSNQLPLDRERIKWQKRQVNKCQRGGRNHWASSI
jgi:hypothetical protein